MTQPSRWSRDSELEGDLGRGCYNRLYWTGMSLETQAVFYPAPRMPKSGPGRGRGCRPQLESESRVPASDSEDSMIRVRVSESLTEAHSCRYRDRGPCSGSGSGSESDAAYAESLAGFKLPELEPTHWQSGTPPRAGDRAALRRPLALKPPGPWHESSRYLLAGTRRRAAWPAALTAQLGPHSVTRAGLGRGPGTPGRPTHRDTH
jgi:hypothetical protein